MKALLVGVALCGAGWQLGGCTMGGCFTKHSNFTVTPAQSSLKPIFDVCDHSSVKLQNDCAEDLVVDTSAAPSGTPAQSIAHGRQAELRGDAFRQSGGRFSVPAKLGATSIVISWEAHDD